MKDLLKQSPTLYSEERVLRLLKNPLPLASTCGLRALKTRRGAARGASAGLRGAGGGPLA